ncbi:TonB-dependent receptor [Neiella sp. HB171785]|uniref:TonB-dependent receptor n=1 Tax=Neiella litorisoli TaxID=2771431 RepID=A0A8J6QEX0_9GAMM|nr:TonB-dependent receptor [Neiella litorisoli]MBD1388344.1 TonB-dependent receptor [Neiella litorisoli]
MKSNFKLSALTAAIITSIMSSSIYAAEEPNQEGADEEVEVIEVRGLRASLRKAVNAKRFADNVTDSIHAEDVGKSTDQNIADALSRVTGVSVQEEGGEGTRISVRGAGPSLNQVSVNGVTLTGGLSTDGSDAGATNDNSVDLSAFSSDILSSIDVVKTAAADQNEGSLGANIELRTVKPLGLNNSRRSFTVEGRHNEFADENDYRINASFSEKFFDETFGVVITASKDTQKTRQDRVRTTWVNGALPIDDLMKDGGHTAHDIATGKPIRVLGYQRDENGDYILDDDGNKQLNPIDSLEGYDPETQALYEGDLYVLARNYDDFSLSTDERDRFSVSVGLQYRPTDDLDIQLDVTHAEQDITTDYHNLRLNYAPVTNVYQGEDVTGLNGIDFGNNTLAKYSSRSAAGNFNRSYGLREVDTDVASLTIDYNITENFSSSLRLGYSKTTDENPDDDEKDRFISISTNTWGTAGRQVVEEMNHDAFERVGYDCSGAQCAYTAGVTPAVFDAFDGTTNIAYSRFTPFDMNHNHLGGLTLRKNKLEDEIKSVFVDFEYLFDFDYLTSIQFGGKWSDRTKDVNIQNRATTNGSDLVDLDDPDADFEVRGMGSIRLGDILATKSFPYDNYAKDLVNSRGNDFFGGWPMLDADKALELVSGKDASEVGLRETRAGTRYIETKTKAAYIKANFEALEGQLTGNVGVRWVRDENSAKGIGGITYVKFPQMLDAYDLLVTRNLADMSQEPCPDAIMGIDTRYTPENDDQLRNCWAWQVTHAYNYTNDATIPYDSTTGEWLVKGPDGQTGPDVNRLVFMDENGNLTLNQLPSQIYDADGNLVNSPRSQWAHFGSAGHIWPWLDRTTAFTGPGGDGQEVQVREFESKGSGEQDTWLPSLNLNYAINDDMIGRFAVTRTMTRPRFDSLNPRNQVREEQWAPTATGSAGNTELKPLKSTNLDLSWEWYFDESGLLSVAGFYKDMEDFEETVIIPFHYKDIRTEYELETADLLLPFDPNRLPGDEDDCSPMRQVAGFFDQWDIQCDVVNVVTQTNGKGAEIKGLEVTYNQNYDFLPGIWSGLGLNMNYTYQSSESDKEEIGDTGVFLKPLPQPYTPENSLNTTLYWEDGGIQLRLASRYQDDVLVSRGQAGGAIWQEDTHRLDFSSAYPITDQISVTFQVLNLTEESFRTYYTSSNTRNVNDPNSIEVVMDEGNALDGGVPKNRTVSTWQTGRQWRLGIRGSF